MPEEEKHPAGLKSLGRTEEGFQSALAVNATGSQAATALAVLPASSDRERGAVPLLTQAVAGIGELQQAIAKEVLANGRSKAAVEALAQSQAAFRNLLSELQESWPLGPPLPSAPTPTVAKPLPLWDQDLEFNRICQKIDYTLVDAVRCYILYQFVKAASELEGDLAEVGVYKGGSARLISRTIAPRAQKTVHLFDTFAGMPAADARLDFHQVGDFADTSLEAVQRGLSDCRNLRFYQGFFPDTAGPIESKKFCLVHVDVNIHDSVRDCCAFFYPRMERNGIMVFDDYGFDSCPGARQAVDEFFVDKREEPFYLPSGQCFVVRK